MLGEIGSLEWTRRTNGILGRGERARYMAATVLTQARVAPRLLAQGRRGARGHPTSPDPGELSPPDSTLAREAVEKCAALMPPTFVEHSYRSYIYARALGSVEGLAADEELLFVATMCHDLGAIRPDASDGGRCFTLAGAELAQRLLDEEAGPDRARAAAEAITLHINPVVDPGQGVEAHLMHDGVLLDAVGLRSWEIDRGVLEAARSRHPRLGFGREAIEALRAQARAIPGCRIAAAIRCGFGLSVRMRG